jgi:dihydrolipoamide dehydrogenase
MCQSCAIRHKAILAAAQRGGDGFATLPVSPPAPDPQQRHGKQNQRHQHQGGPRQRAHYRQRKHKVESVKTKGKEATVTADNGKGEKVEIKGDYVLMAVGRKPYTEGLNLEKAGVKLDLRGRVEVDAHLKTSADNIYAIGDVVVGAMLAHKAEEEGVFVAEQIAGQKPHIDYNLIPGVVYTWPEVAAVGQTEEQLKEKGIKYKVGSFPFKASGRARASMDTDGFVKVLADETTDEILGVHMIGPRTADMIAEAVVAMEYRASAEDISRISHAHPTFTESLKEAALDATGKRALHI